jgi:hypothetical protein
MKAVTPLALVSATTRSVLQTICLDYFSAIDSKTNHLPDLLVRRVWQSGEIDEISPEFASIYRRGEDEECEDQDPLVF